MKIGINGYYLSKPYTGIGQYSTNLIHHLSVQSGGKHTITVFSDINYLTSCVSKLHNVEYIVINNSKCRNDVVDMFWFEYSLKLKAAQCGIDILHSPYLPSSLLHNNTYPHVVTIHDVIPKIYKEYRGSFLRHMYMSYGERNVNRADIIITDSAHSKMDIHKYLGIEPSKINIVGIASDTVFDQNIDEKITKIIKSRYSLPNDFIFYIGGFDFRKNVRVLLQAYAEARKNGVRELLVLGGGFEPSKKQLDKRIVENVPEIARELDIQDHVRFIGSIPQEDLPHIYRLARLFVYPSLYEGFGLPPLEAMKCGTPVLASNCSSIPEVVCRDDLLFDPCDAKALCSKIVLMLRDNELRSEVGTWGARKAKSFSWSITARLTLELYASVF